jgi:hypothetical protein
MAKNSLHTFVKNPFNLLTIWTTPMTRPRMQIGMHKIDFVVYPV